MNECLAVGMLFIASVLTFPVWWTDAENGPAWVGPIETGPSAVAWVGPTRGSLAVVPQGMAVLTVCQHQLGHITILCCQITVVSGVYHI
jgi:hypothetical protein